MNFNHFVIDDVSQGAYLPFRIMLSTCHASKRLNYNENLIALESILSISSGLYFYKVRSTNIEIQLDYDSRTKYLYFFLKKKRAS